MVEVNRLLTDINTEILENNDEIVSFNKACLEENSSFLSCGITTTGVTSESNAALATSNASRILGVLARAQENHSAQSAVVAVLELSCARTDASREEIYRQRASIQQSAVEISAKLTEAARTINCGA